MTGKFQEMRNGLGRTIHRFVGVAVAALIATSGALAQEVDQPRASFFAPVDVPLVSIEVFVHDRDGRPVPGLAIEDFEVFEDGNPVAISHFYAAPGVVTPDVGGSGEERTRRRHRRHHALDIGGTLDLEAVGAVVPHGVGIEEFVKISHEL